MRPVYFPEANVELRKPPHISHPECPQLPAYRADGIILSCWSLSLMDRIRVLMGKPVWLMTVGDRQPPVNVVTKYPFGED